MNEIDHSKEFQFINMKNELLNEMKELIDSHSESNNDRIIAELQKELMTKLNPELEIDDIEQLLFDRLAKVSQVTPNEVCIMSNGMAINRIMERHKYGTIYKGYNIDTLKLNISRMRKGRAEMLEATKNISESQQQEESVGMIKKLFSRNQQVPM